MPTFHLLTRCLSTGDQKYSQESLRALITTHADKSSNQRTRYCRNPIAAVPQRISCIISHYSPKPHPQNHNFVSAKTQPQKKKSALTEHNNQISQERTSLAARPQPQYIPGKPAPHLPLPIKIRLHLRPHPQLRQLAVVGRVSEIQQPLHPPRGLSNSAAVGEALEARLSAIGAVPGVADAAEGDSGDRAVVEGIVYRGAAGAELAEDAVGFFGGAEGVEAQGRGVNFVGDADGGVEVVDGEDRHEGAEGLVGD